MPICTRCDFRNVEGARFCGNCGVPMSAPNPPIWMGTPPPPVFPKPGISLTSRRFIAWVSAIAIGIFILLVVIGTLLPSSPNQSDASRDTASQTVDGSSATPAELAQSESKIATLAGRSNTDRLDGLKIVKVMYGTVEQVRVIFPKGWAGVDRSGALLEQSFSLELPPDALKALPFHGDFQTNFQISLPPTDIVNGPDSERIWIYGNCPSRTYQIWGTQLLKSDVPQAGSGFEDVHRKVEDGTVMWYVFDFACTQ